MFVCLDTTYSLHVRGSFCVFIRYNKTQYRSSGIPFSSLMRGCPLIQKLMFWNPPADVTSSLESQAPPPAPGADVSNVTCHKTGPMSPPLSSEPEKHVSGQQVLSVSARAQCHVTWRRVSRQINIIQGWQQLSISWILSVVSQCELSEDQVNHEQQQKQQQWVQCLVNARSVMIRWSTGCPENNVPMF